jgi:DNA end-binding protein Ku
MLSTMAFADEVVDPATIDELAGLDDIKINAKELAMAEQLVESLAGEFEPEKFTDSYREQVLDLIAKKAAGEAFEAPEPAAAAPQVIDLMAALEASVKAAKEARGRHPATVKAVSEAPSGRRKAAAAQAAATTQDDADEDADDGGQVAEKKPARSRARKSA